VKFGRKVVDNKCDVLRWFDSKLSRATVLSGTRTHSLARSSFGFCPSLD
jgi:hypothetical protein